MHSRKKKQPEPWVTFFCSHIKAPHGRLFGFVLSTFGWTEVQTFGMVVCTEVHLSVTVYTVHCMWQKDWKLISNISLVMFYWCFLHDLAASVSLGLWQPRQEVLPEGVGAGVIDLLVVGHLRLYPVDPGRQLGEVRRGHGGEGLGQGRRACMDVVTNSWFCT